VPFPETPRVVYERNPLVEVICQLRFPTILRIASEPPVELQERLRGEYPVFREEQGGLPGVPPEVSRVLTDLPLQLRAEPSYTFESEDGQRAISLSREFVAVTERNYEHWQGFSAQVELVKSAVEEIYAPSFYSRVGLRYQDMIDRETLDLADVPWQELVDTPIAGLLGSDEIRDDVRQTISITEVAVPEIQGASVRLQYGLAEREGQAGQVFVMDADFYTTERNDPDNVFETLNAFNHHAGNFWRWSITERLRDALRPSPVRDDTGTGTVEAA
jgi:uncharacterized protein (TIGR04255 family)